MAATALTPDFKRIRHYGPLAPAAMRQRLAAARRSLQMPQPNPVAQEDAQAILPRFAAVEVGHCPRGATGRW